MELNREIVVEKKVNHKITMFLTYGEAQDLGRKINNVNTMLPVSDSKLEALVNLLNMIPNDTEAIRIEDRGYDDRDDY